MYSELRQKHLETCKFYKNVAAVTLNSIKIVWNPFQNDKSNKTSKINIGIKTTLVTAWIVTARHGLSQATIHALHVCGSLLCIQLVEACLCIVPFVTQFCPSWLSGNFIKHCSHPPCINKPPISEMCISIKARSHQRPDQPPLSPALEKWTDRQWAGLDRRERMLV